MGIMCFTWVDFCYELVKSKINLNLTLRHSSYNWIRLWIGMKIRFWNKNHCWNQNFSVVLTTVQGDTAGSSKPPIDFKTKVLLWPGQARLGQAKTELLFWCQREVLNSLLCPPVFKFRLLWIPKRFSNRQTDQAPNLNPDPLPELQHLLVSPNFL